MHCGVMVTSYNQADWERLMSGSYERPPSIPDSVQVDNTLAMGELVEPLGFDSIWATEHYGSAYSMQPNPMQWLAYWAGRTQRVDVGTAVIVAPWWNPVRLAHELAMLDLLLKGRRVHLGIGRGISPHEYASLGVPIDESHAYFYDVVNAIRAADGAEQFTFDGEVFKIPETSVRPQPRHKGHLTDNIKVAFTTERSAHLAAEHGLGQMFVAQEDFDEMTARVQRFNRIRASLGLPPDQPTTLLWMYCAETSSEAEEGWEYFQNQLLAAQHHYFEWKNPGFEGIRGYEEYLVRQSSDAGDAKRRFEMRKATQPIGTPDDIIDKITNLQRVISLGEVVIHVCYGGMPHDKAIKSMRLFAEKVLPTVQALATPINPASTGA
jgi:alkanesulfonate monooxygenase SsuD/methylene tetrahydromethanopterin reductase-like flavin-dependent oxidoreductase (luciferase family)